MAVDRRGVLPSRRIPFEASTIRCPRLFFSQCVMTIEPCKRNNASISHHEMEMEMQQEPGPACGSSVIFFMLEY